MTMTESRTESPIDDLVATDQSPTEPDISDLLARYKAEGHDPRAALHLIAFLDLQVESMMEREIRLDRHHLDGVDLMLFHDVFVAVFPSNQLVSEPGSLHEATELALAPHGSILAICHTGTVDGKIRTCDSLLKISVDC